MDDLISRVAAIDAAIEAADDWDGGCNKERERFIRDALEQLPSAQPKIIRCKDCKFAINVGTTDMMCKNSRSWVVATDNSFGCVLAERRTDG